MDAKIKEVVWNTIPDESEYIVGFANLEGLLHQRFRAYEYGISIGKKLDDAIIDGIAEGPTHEYFHLYHETNQHLTELVNTIVECLRALNIASLGIVTLTDLDRTDDYEMTLRPALSHKMVATRAGLGWIGKTALFISKKFGPRLRLGSILLDYPVGSSEPPINASQCGDCRICVDHCPAQAANGKLWDIHTDRDEFFDALKCKVTANRLALERIQQNMRVCGICVSVCPRGQQQSAR